MKSNEIEEARGTIGPIAIRALAVGAQSVGAIAVGAVALSAVAIGFIAIGRRAIRSPFAWERSTMTRGFARNITRSWMIVRRGMRSPMTCRNIAELGAKMQVHR